MPFKITSGDQTLTLSEEDLFTQVLGQALKEQEEKNKIDNVEKYVSFIETILMNLNPNKNNLDVTFRQMFTIYFLCGYYYKIFLSKNNVEIIEKET